VRSIGDRAPPMNPQIGSAAVSILFISVASTAACPVGAFIVPNGGYGIDNAQSVIDAGIEDFRVTNTPKTDPVSLWPGNEPPTRGVYAPGIQEEKPIRFGLPSSILRTFDDCKLGTNAELLAEELEIEFETLWQMSALAFATVQRLAHDQAEIFAGVLGELTRSSLAQANNLAEEELPSPVYPPDAAPIVSDGMIRSFGDIVAVVEESYRELVDIQTERLLTWVSTLRTISGRNG
jgi:hypothetical protein